jgi:antiviral helicase SKI2
MVYFLPDEELPQVRELHTVLAGKPMRLKSAFRLTYSLILNILRVDELRVEDMMKRSFAEAAGELKLENINEVVAKADVVVAKMDEEVGTMPNEDQLDKYAKALVRISNLSQVILPQLVASPKFGNAFASGRLVIILRDDHLLSLAVIVTSSAPTRGKARLTDLVRLVYVTQHAGLQSASCANAPSASVLIEPFHTRCTRADSPLQNAFPYFVAQGLRFCMADVPISQVVWFGRDRIEGLPIMSMALDLQERFLRAEAIQSAVAFLADVTKTKFGPRRVLDSDTPEFDPYVALSKIASQWAERDEQISSLISLPSTASDNLTNLIWNLSESRKVRTRVLAAYVGREQLRSQLSVLRATVSTRGAPDLLPEYQKRVQVLQKLKYVGDDGVSVLLKGRSGACEVATVDSVMLTEIILDNTLDGLEPAEVASLLSSLVCRKKNKNAFKSSTKPIGAIGVASPSGTKDSAKYSKRYHTAKAAMRDVVHRFGQAQKESGIDLVFDIADAADYEDSMCRWALAEVVLEWARGAPFAKVAKLTDLQEGDIVVCVKRLVELLKDAMNVARAVGNDELCSSLEAATEVIRRDIIFSGSLYLD